MAKKRPDSVAENAVFFPARMCPRLLTDEAHSVALACAPVDGMACWISATISERPMNVPSRPSIMTRLTAYPGNASVHFELSFRMLHC